MSIFFVAVYIQADVERRRIIAEGRQCGIQVVTDAFNVTDPSDTG